jgi:hypothetical protein
MLHPPGTKNQPPGVAGINAGCQALINRTEAAACQKSKPTTGGVRWNTALLPHNTPVRLEETARKKRRVIDGAVRRQFIMS